MCDWCSYRSAALETPSCSLHRKSLLKTGPGRQERWAATPGLGRKERPEANDKCVLVFAQLQTLSSVNELLLSPDLGILLE